MGEGSEEGRRGRMGIKARTGEKDPRREGGNERGRGDET